MRVLVFDTETTGLPKTKFIELDSLGLWPHVVQFSYIIYDTEQNHIVEIKDYIVKIPKGVLISEESTNIHGITNEICEQRGFQIEDILNEFFYYLQNVDTLVGHNISFDINMLRVELLRIIHVNPSNYCKSVLSTHKNNMLYLNNLKNIRCTLKESIELCNLKATSKMGRPYIKYPKLSELHEKLFNVSPNNLHNSLHDILLTLRCYIKMNMDRDINECCEHFKVLMHHKKLVHL